MTSLSGSIFFKSYDLRDIVLDLCGDVATVIGFCELGIIVLCFYEAENASYSSFYANVIKSKC